MHLKQAPAIITAAKVFLRSFDLDGVVTNITHFGFLFVNQVCTIFVNLFLRIPIKYIRGCDSYLKKKCEEVQGQEQLQQKTE